MTSGGLKGELKLRRRNEARYWSEALGEGRVLEEIYQPGSSVLHRLDPRFKTASLAMLSGLTTGIGSWGLLVDALGVLALMGLSRLTWRAYRPVFMVVFWLALFYGLTAGWVWNGWRIWEGHWSNAGLALAGMMTVRIALIFVLTRIFAAVTPPLEQGLGIAYFLGPLSRLTPKAADFALLLTLTLRFIPLLAEEAGLLWKARVVRGTLPNNWLLRLSDLAGLFPPLLLLTLRRAEEVAENLMARGYAPGRYRVVNLHKWSSQDSLALLVVCLWGYLMVWTNSI